MWSCDVESACAGRYDAVYDMLYEKMAQNAISNVDITVDITRNVTSEFSRKKRSFEERDNSLRAEGTYKLCYFITYVILRYTIYVMLYNQKSYC